jgi:Tol biopolymer transport system component
LIGADSKAMYAPPGYVVFVRDETLMAQPFDARAGQVSGDPFAIATPIRVNVGNARATFSVSESGVLTYRSGNAFGDSQVTVFDRTGNALQTLGPPGDYRGMALSPNETQIAVHRHEDPVGGGLWVLDMTRGPVSRVTSDASHNFMPRWAPDGRLIVFASNRGSGVFNLYRTAASGTTKEEQIRTAETEQTPSSWSFDGRFIVYENADPTTRSDVWVLPVTGDTEPILFLRTAFSEGQGHLSPDGRWMAYTSNETGRNQIYVQPFPPSGQKWTISTDGGVQPRWRRDGKELFYLTEDASTEAKWVMVSDVLAEGATFRPGVPRPMFKTQLNSGRHDIPIGPTTTSDSYAVSADGKRLIGLVQAGRLSEEPITVLVNFAAAFKR